jgi:hypothetical protein
MLWVIDQPFGLIYLYRFNWTFLNEQSCKNKVYESPCKTIQPQEYIINIVCNIVLVHNKILNWFENICCLFQLKNGNRKGCMEYFSRLWFSHNHWRPLQSWNDSLSATSDILDYHLLCIVCLHSQSTCGQH